MKKAALSVLVVAIGLLLAGTVLADSATKDECMAKGKETAQFINEKGLEAAVAELNKKDGKFAWKDSYVFLMDFSGKMLGHPNPKLVGVNTLEMTDKAEKGKPIFKEFVAVAKDKGEGWVDYMWPKPGETTPVKKVSYIYRVPGKDLLVGAGYYE